MSALADEFANRFSVSGVDFQNKSNLSICSRNLLGFVVVRIATSPAHTAQLNSRQPLHHQSVACIGAVQRRFQSGCAESAKVVTWSQFLSFLLIAPSVRT